MENRDVVASYVENALARLCGGGISEEVKCCNGCQEKQLLSCKKETQETKFTESLHQLAAQSISYPNGEPKKCMDESSNLDKVEHQTLLGTAHDIEIRVALSFFHRYRHKCMATKKKNKGIAKQKKKKLKRNTSSSEEEKESEKSKCDQIAPPPLEIISDLGLIRPIYSAIDLASLLVKEIEDALWQERTIENTYPQTNHDGQNITSTGTPPIIRPDKSGIICLVTPERVDFLKNCGRLPCSQCVKWCKGEKGLWWHEQMEHKVDHSSATSKASSCFGEKTLAIVLYKSPTNICQSKSPTNICQSKCIVVETKQKPSSQTISQTENDVYFDLVKEGCLDKFKLFLGSHQGKRYNPKEHMDRNKASALHWASGCGHLSIVKYLIEECGCAPDQAQLGKRSFCGRTPLHWSARNGHINVVQYLIEDCNTNIDATTIDGTTAFCWACWQGHLEIMKYLHYKGTDVHMVNSFGCNAVLWSAQSTTAGLKAIIWLESIGVDVNKINFNGHGVIHKAAQRGKEDVCRWMVHKNSTTQISFFGPDEENYCPSDIAGMEGHVELAEWLVTEEAKSAVDAYQRKFLPNWLQDGINGSQHLINRACLDGLYENGAGIKKMSIHVEQTTTTDKENIRFDT